MQRNDPEMQMQRNANHAVVWVAYICNCKLGNISNTKTFTITEYF